MKQLLIVLAVLGFASLAGRPAQAHFLKTDGSVGSLLNIEPDDDPVIGETSTLIFTLTDKNNKVTVANCDCQVAIAKNGATLVTTPLNQVATDTGQLAYIFPEEGRYTITLTGKPLEAGTYPSFSVPYDFQIDRTTSTTSKNPVVTFASDHWWWALVVVGGLAAAIAVKQRKQ